MSAHAAADRFALLEARHVDDLNDSVRNLTRHLAKQADVDARQLSETKALRVSVDDLNVAVRELVKILKGGVSETTGTKHAPKSKGEKAKG